MSDIIKVSDAPKHLVSPFMDGGMLKIDSHKKTIITGKASEVIIDPETGDLKGQAVMHRYKEVDKTQFVKLFIGEVSALFDLSKAGLKVFGFVLNQLPINKGEVYIHIPDLMEWCSYKTKKQAYKGLGELLHNNIIAMSNRPSVWYINPAVVFNGDRISFIKEYRLKNPEPQPKQLNMYEEE